MTFRLNFGEKERDKGIKKVASHNAEWLMDMRAEAVRVARANGVVTNDDLRRYANKTGKQPRHSGAWGAIFRGSPEPGWHWVVVGYRASYKETNHARRIAVWRLSRDKK